MKLALAAFAAAMIVAPAGAARSDRGLGPLGDVVWTARTIQLVLTRLDLNHNQRDKVLELLDRTRQGARDIQGNHDISWSRRQERLLDLSNDLRGRVIHVLTGEQKDRLQDMMSGRGDRYGRSNRNNRDNRSNGDRYDWPWNY